jgi:hypothetical protein
VRVKESYVVLIKAGVEVRPNVGTVDGDEQPSAAGHWVACGSLESQRSFHLRRKLFTIDLITQRAAPSA